MKGNILFIFSRHSKNPNDSTLTKDLSDEFKRQGWNVYIATMQERKNNEKTELNEENGCQVLRVRTGNYFDSPGRIEKGITVATMPYLFKREIIRNFGEVDFQMIFTHTPFMANSYLIGNLKKHFDCPTYLDLWDIFPQNAKDIGLLKNRVLLQYFRYQEKKMLKTFDYIGCMSEGNREYILDKNSFLDEEKVHILRNWSVIKPKIDVDKVAIKRQFGYSSEDFIAIFGGNMGKPQKLDNFLKLASEVKEYERIKFLFVGKGTEGKRLKELKDEMGLKNVDFKKFVPRDDYERLVAACDLGIVSLDERFTVPNFPSKTTDYFKLEIPIIASLDEAALKDYGHFLKNRAQAGLTAGAGNTEKLKEQLLKLYKDKKLLETLGKNGRIYYEDNLGVEKAYRVIADKARVKVNEEIMSREIKGEAVKI